MDLHSSYPFWLLQNGLLGIYPPLGGDTRTDVLVVGGGISGALCAASLADLGMTVVLVDSREICTGSTCASTGLLMYEMDLELCRLREKRGHDVANTAYGQSRAALDTIPGWIAKAGGEEFCGYRRKETLYVASRRRDAALLREELTARHEIGLRCDLLERGELEQRFGLHGYAALLGGPAAECDTYAFTHGLLRYAVNRGVQVCDRTSVESMTENPTGVSVMTTEGHTITADKVVMAAGYESQQWLKKRVADNRETFVLISDPVDDLPDWLQKTHVWETARPYLYTRTTPDSRIIVGGGDLRFKNASARDALLPRKTRRLHKHFEKLLPGVPLSTAFTWAGTFAETTDSMPRIGLTPEWKHVYFAMGYGGNGITFSVLAADIISGELAGTPRSYAPVFAFDD